MAIDYDKLGQIWEEKGVMDLLREKYTKEINELWDWENVHNYLHSCLGDEDFLMNAYETQELGEDPHVGMCVGKVYTLNPSGKYYMPWACSNVTAKEALKDECWQEALDEILTEWELYASGGEGDPCDVFFCKKFERINWLFPISYKVSKVIDLVEQYNDAIRMFEDYIVPAVGDDDRKDQIEELIEKIEWLLK